MTIIDADFALRALQKEVDRLCPDGVDMRAVEALWRSEGFTDEEVIAMSWAPKWIAISWSACKYVEIERAKKLLVANGYEFLDEPPKRGSRKPHGK